MIVYLSFFLFSMRWLDIWQIVMVEQVDICLAKEFDPMTWDFSSVCVLSKNDNFLVTVQILQGLRKQHPGARPSSVPAPILYCLSQFLLVCFLCIACLNFYWLVFFERVKPHWRFPGKLEHPKEKRENHMKSFRATETFTTPHSFTYLCCYY